MSQLPQHLKYTASHEWLRQDNDGDYTVGITDHAQSLLGDMVYVELPSVGQQVKAAAESGVVESVKAASDIYSPVSGEVIAVNEALVGEPALVNTSPYEQGWLYRIRASQKSELASLLDAAAYAELLAKEAH